MNYQIIAGKCPIEVGGDCPLRPQGEWINPSENPEFSNREFFYDCSICGNTQMDETNFCPNCGADMRGGKE